MSGHSKWSSIKHKKGALDAKRGKIFSKMNKEITVAARLGGGDLTANPRLRMIVQKAKDANMPSDNIDRAIKKGTGDLEGVSYEEMVYEGYGPGGVALIIQTLSDNKNRTSSEVRSTLDKRGGKMASPGAVSYLFSKKGLLVVPQEAIAEDKLMEIVLDAGAEDLTLQGDVFEVTTGPQDYEAVYAAVKAANLQTRSAEITEIPSTLAAVDKSTAQQALNLVEALEDLDDVQNVYSNIDIPDDLLE